MTHSMNNSRLAVAVAILAACIPQNLRAAELQQSTLTAWQTYLAEVDTHMQQRIAGKQTFLWADESADRAARVRRGEVVIAPITANGMKHVPKGLIHDWIGAVFIPNATIDSLWTVLLDYDKYKQVYRPVVTESRVLSCTKEKQEFVMAWQKRALFVSAAMQGRYQAVNVQVDSHRGYILAEATEVREIVGYGRKNERMLPPDTGNGYVWRIQSVERYEERDGGVYLEVEAIVLTRDIPESLNWLVSPVVNRLSIQSVTTTLSMTRDAVVSIRGEAERLTHCQNPIGASITATGGGMK